MPPFSPTLIHLASFGRNAPPKLISKRDGGDKAPFTTSRQVAARAGGISAPWKEQLSQSLRNHCCPRAVWSSTAGIS